MPSTIADDSISVFSAYSAGSAGTLTGNGSARQRPKKRKGTNHGRRRTSEAQKPEFTTETLLQGLSQLGKTADGVRSAYLRLDVSGTNMSNTDALTAYSELQTLNLTCNQLSSLAGLQQLPRLTAIDVSSNVLQRILDFEAPPGGSNLRTANFARNRILLANDISRFSRLTSLNLDYNRLETLVGVGSLPLLSHLSLSFNQLHTLRGIEGLTGLRKLSVEGNQIKSLAAVSGLTCLEHLQATRNCITSLTPLQGLVRLQTLDVSYNQLHSLSDLGPCATADHLRELKVIGNPLCASCGARLHIVHLLPHVSLLDDQEVSAEEKVRSANMHGADADELRHIRRKYFPAGELDDGGSAAPPPAAGLVASRAEEEVSDAAGINSVSVRIDAFARSVPIPDVIEECSMGDDAPITTIQEEASTNDEIMRGVSPSQAAPGLLVVATQLQGACSGQLETARACLEWVTSHISLPRNGRGSACVQSPLFDTAHGGARAEAALLKMQQGTWAERASMLFVLLAKACELEAVIIAGFSKALGSIYPGSTLAVHNHCWAGVKVNGRWRLVDPTMCCMHGGTCSSPEAPFFVPPEAWIYMYHPLEAHWQLLPDPISLDDWWQLPHLSIGFFAKGLKLIEPAGLSAVNTTQSTREGGILPTFQVCIAAPVNTSDRLQLTVKELDTGRTVVMPQGTEDPVDGTATSFQQVQYGPGSTSEVQFGAITFLSRTHQLVAALPGPGEYLLEVHHVREVPGGVSVSVEGMSSPLLLRLQDTEIVLSTKVIVPEIEPHDPEDGLLHDAAVSHCLLPSIHHPAFHQSRVQLLLPPVGEQLEADRTYTFQLLAPGGSQLAIMTPDGQQTPFVQCSPPSIYNNPQGSRPSSSRPSSSATQPVTYEAQLQLPRVSHLQVAQHRRATSPEGGWTPLLTFHVRPQAQHIVDISRELDVPHVEFEDPQAVQARELYSLMDKKADGKVTRAKMLKAARHSKQVTDSLKFPGLIRAHDGTLDRFHEQYQAIDVRREEAVSFDDLCFHLHIKPSEMLYSEGDEGDDDDDDEQSWSGSEDGDEYVDGVEVDEIQT